MVARKQRPLTVEQGYTHVHILSKNTVRKTPSAEIHSVKVERREAQTSVSLTDLDLPLTYRK